MKIASTLFGVCLLTVLSFFASPLTAQDKPEVISSFEEGGPKWVKHSGEAVAEHVTDGKLALKLVSEGKDFTGLTIDDPAPLRKFKDFILLKVDVFNPHETPIRMGVRIDDTDSKDYGSRYNDDGVVVRPGKSTIEVNLTGLTKSNARNFDQRERLDASKVRMVMIFIHPAGKSQTAFFDNVRLETSGLPKVEGLRAIDFGPVMAPVYPGFDGCTNKTVYSDEAGYGFVGGGDAGYNVYMPDALSGDHATGKEFRIKVPNGKYEVNVCMDVFGLWGYMPHYSYRKLVANGKTVIDQKQTADEFLNNVYLMHEDDEDLPGQDLWKKYIESHQKNQRFTVEVTDGTISLQASSDVTHARGLSYVIAYPQSVAKEGRAFMDTLDKRRSERFNQEMVVTVPRQDNTPATAEPADDIARGFFTFGRHSESDINVNSYPTKEERSAGVVLHAAIGERESGQFGIFPLSDAKGATVTVSDLISGDRKIPASAIRVRKVRNFLKRSGMSRAGNLVPYILQDFKTLDLQKGVTRGIWLTVAVPDNAIAGTYAGTVKVATGDKSLSVPVALTVFPFKLDKIDNMTISVTGSTAGSWRGRYPELEQQWWAMAEKVMANQAEHGMNAITGGPGATLKTIKDGKATIDYTHFDRWLKLAVKHGLTMPGDSYQGLDVSGMPNYHDKDCITKSQAEARQKWGVSYEELLRVVYSDVEEHIKSEGLPKRVFSFLDEPRPEYGNVEVCAKMIEIRTKAAPKSLFSGYYSTGDGRDVYFQTMPVSIAHVDAKSMELIKDAGKQIWDYSGDRVRHNIGRWCYVANKAGMGGFLRNGYMYVASMPYFDFSDDEGSWSVVYPSKNGLNDAVGWERTAEGVDDLRYLLTLERLIEKANKAAGGDRLVAAVAAAQATINETTKDIKVEKKETARLSGDGYEQFKQKLAKHIMELQKGLEPN